MRRERVKDADCHELSLVEDTQPIAQSFGFVHVMRRVQDDIAIVAEAAREIKNFFARLRNPPLPSAPPAR